MDVSKISEGIDPGPRSATAVPQAPQTRSRYHWPLREDLRPSCK